MAEVTVFLGPAAETVFLLLGDAEPGGLLYGAQGLPLHGRAAVPFDRGLFAMHGLAGRVGLLPKKRLG
jgi:hypothetical protein